MLRIEDTQERLRRPARARRRDAGAQAGRARRAGGAQRRRQVDAAQDHRRPRRRRQRPRAAAAGPRRRLPGAGCRRRSRAARCTTRCSSAVADLLAHRGEMRAIERPDRPPPGADLDALVHAPRRAAGAVRAPRRLRHRGRSRPRAGGLGFAEADRDRRTEEFSGGWQMRIALARLLLGRPDVLLLDEPTNHLDLAATEWLEDYVKASRATMLIVSHDRYFLDSVVQRVFELRRGASRRFRRATTRPTASSARAATRPGRTSPSASRKRSSGSRRTSAATKKATARRWPRAARRCSRASKRSAWPRRARIAW